jgi:predicted transcriptional regulator
MVNTLVEQKSLSRREIEELRAILDRMEGVK